MQYDFRTSTPVGGAGCISVVGRVAEVFGKCMATPPQFKIDIKRNSKNDELDKENYCPEISWELMKWRGCFE